MNMLYDAQGKTCWITVTETAATRYLELDGCEEGAMSRTGDNPVFQYVWFHKCSHLAAGRRRLLVLGAGAFTAAKCLALDCPQAAVDAVDVEPDLGLVGRRFFGLDRPEFGRVAFHGMPAEAFLKAGRPPYDFIFDDQFDGFEHVPQSTRAGQYFALLRGVLADGGVCVKNLIWNPHSADTRGACEEAGEALAAAFPRYAVLALADEDRGHNRLLLGSTGRISLAWERVYPRLAAAGMPENLLREVRCLRCA